MSEVVSLIRSRALQTGVEVKLASGQMSNYYVDSKQITLHGPSLRIISQAKLKYLLEVEKNLGAVAGVSIGGDPLVAGVLVEAAQQNISLDGYLVRKSAKDHGLSQGKRIEGPKGPFKGPVWLLEDVISTGGSAASAIEHLLEQGCPLKGVLCILDREMGGAEHLSQKYSLAVHSLAKVSQVLNS